MQEKKVLKSSKTRPVIRFPSIKMGRSLYCESQLEVLACLIREFDPQIIKYATQPVSFTFPIEGKVRRYTPDAIVKTRSQRIFFEEVKPISTLRSPTKRRAVIAKKLAFEQSSRQRYELVVNTVYKGDQMDTFSSNLYNLYKYLRSPASPLGRELVAALPKKTAIGVFELPKPLQFTPEFYSLVAHGFLSINLEHEFSEESYIQRIK